MRQLPVDRLTPKALVLDVAPPAAGAAPPENDLLASVKIGLHIGIDTSTRAQTEVQILNAPDVSGL